MKHLFENYNLAVEKQADAQREVEDAVNAIVKELQKERGYVEFTMDTGYPTFYDETIGRDLIIAVKYVDEDDEIKLITDSQGCQPGDEESEDKWFSWYLYGDLNFNELVNMLKVIANQE